MQIKDSLKQNMAEFVAGEILIDKCILEKKKTKDNSLKVLEKHNHCCERISIVTFVFVSVYTCSRLDVTSCCVMKVIMTLQYNQEKIKEDFNKTPESNLSFSLL